jgi:hypothetical protein
MLAFPGIPKIIGDRAATCDVNALCDRPRTHTHPHHARPPAPCPPPRGVAPPYNYAPQASPPVPALWKKTGFRSFYLLSPPVIDGGRLIRKDVLMPWKELDEPTDDDERETTQSRFSLGRFPRTKSQFHRSMI